MTPLQSWLLLIATFAVLLLLVFVIFAVIGAIAVVIDRWRERRAYRRRFQAYAALDDTTRKLIINSLYGKMSQDVTNALRNGRRNGHSHVTETERPTKGVGE